jgi:hypothetical protein
MSEPVNVDNFVRAETDRMFAALQAQAGGVNQLHHDREPTSIDKQTVIRMNRDTLYSVAIVDISQGATLTIPDAGDRYVSVMVVNQDHYLNRVFHDAGDYALTVDEFDTPWVTVAARILVDPADSDDVKAVNALQDQFALATKSADAFEMPDYDTASFDATREALLTLIWSAGCQLRRGRWPRWFAGSGSAGGAHWLSSTSVSRLICAGWCRMTGYAK